jgi:hypothetical protein
VEVPVLLACLSAALGMVAALLAFILARAGGKSAYPAVREAGVAFVAATTLAILLLNFTGAGTARQSPPPSAPATTTASRG